jgi:hypothetical protein
MSHHRTLKLKSHSQGNYPRSNSPPKVDLNDLDNGSNPRGDLETICRRDSRFEWPNFETFSEGPTHHQNWVAICSLQVQFEHKKTNFTAKGIHPKKTRAISLGKTQFLCFSFNLFFNLAAAEMLEKVMKIKKRFDDEQLFLENKIIADKDLKLHPERSYSLSELISSEIDRLSKLPDRCPNESKREWMNSLASVRYSFPFMLSQPGASRIAESCQDFDQLLKEMEMEVGLE